MRNIITNSKVTNRLSFTSNDFNLPLILAFPKYTP